METLYNYIIKPIIKLYLKTEPTVKFDDFKIKVFKTVFHPTLFFSSSYFYKFLNSKDFYQKSVLEIGCGTGVLSMLAHKKNAQVTSCDINVKAIENTKYNFAQNKFGNKNDVEFYVSDVFSTIPKFEYDYIIINPPYYFKDVLVAEQYAWNCGENGIYFEKLFSQLQHYMHRETQVLMILAEVCEIERIKNIAYAHQLSMRIIDEQKIKWERSFIFKIERMI